MANFKQDMPPPGGYAPITYQRVPLKSGLSGITKMGIVTAFTIGACYIYTRSKRIINNQRIEMRCSSLALLPMIKAEADRMLLKQLRRNRDAEERIMKDVEGWEVGKWKHSPVYISLEPDEFYKPISEEYYAHTDPNHVRYGIMVWRDLL